MELPKRARTVNWESGVLTLDGEKQFEVPELTVEIMEQLAGYTLVGFHVKSYPVTDELLAPFAGHKSMANFGVEDGALTDACFPVFSAMPKLRYLLLDGNAAIHGSSLSALQGCKLDLLTLNRTGLDDAGLLQAASIPKLSHIQIDHTAVTYEGLLAIAGNNRIEPVAHVQFTQEQMEHFFQLQREKAKKPVQLDEQAAAECRRVLSAFFAEMTQWEQYMEQAGFEGAEAVPRLLTIWEKYVSEKPRPGYRPLGLSYSAQGTYNGEEFLDAEQITKNKLYIYTREKNTGFDRRFLMKRVGEGWKIDAVQERLKFLGLDGILTATCCPNCVGFLKGPAFNSFTLDGGVEVFPSELFDGAEKTDCYVSLEDYKALTENPFVLGEAPVPLFYGAACQDVNTVGGFANWVQDAEYTTCPHCGKPMKYLAQIQWDTVFDCAEGTLYVEFCPDCHIVSMQHQQT